MRACVAIAIALLPAGCTRILGVHDFPPEVVDTTKTCLGTIFPVCFDAALPDPRTLSGSIDTDDALCFGTLVDGSPACIIAATDLTVTDAHVHGSLPLVLVAQDQLTITGVLDAASHDAQIGPDGSSPACVPATPGWNEDRINLRASGGGAGGSFGSAGGDGGPAEASTGSLGGGRASPVAQIVGLRGGCAGSTGGIDVSMMPGSPMLVAAPGGAGGGAVLLVADAIEIDGTVDASGAGGAAGYGGSNMNGHVNSGGGGGGGGSGGLIAIDASIATVSGMLIAHGGGGGGGGDHNLAGASGMDGGPPLDAVAAGGPVQSEGGPGGDGAGDGAAAAIGAMETTLDAGSGGGGGGAGVILSRIAIANASPAVSAP